LEQFELSERKNDRVEGFSKGMKQRVLIASALVHGPHVFFLDEPTSRLDVHSQRFIRTIIREMNDKGTTVFLTTHNIEEVNALSIGLPSSTTGGLRPSTPLNGSSRRFKRRNPSRSRLMNPSM